MKKDYIEHENAEVFEKALSFSVSDEEKELYDKYGVPAIELANDGDFSSAISLIDKILEKKPDTEFALLLKANYLFNNLNFNFSLQEGAETIEDVQVIREQAEKFKDGFEKCVKLINKALKLNPKNDGAKALREFIENGALKAVNDLITTAEETSLNLPKDKFGCKLICPYCNDEYVKTFGLKHSDVRDTFIEECPECSKEYLVMAGKVTLWRSRGTGVVQYGLPEYTVRFKQVNDNDDRTMIIRTNTNLLHVKNGDAIYFTFKKKRFSSDFSDKPHALLNATANTYSLI